MINRLFILLIGIAFVGCDEGERVHIYHENSPQIRLSGVVKNGKNEGSWLELYRNGTKKSEINYKEGLRNGVVTIWYHGELGEDERIRSQGNYLNDLKEGEFTEWTENGEKLIDGNYKKDKEQVLSH